MIGNEAVEALWRLPAELLGSHGAIPSHVTAPKSLCAVTRPILFRGTHSVDSARVTLNVALDEASCDGSELLALHEDGLHFWYAARATRPSTRRPSPYRPPPRLGRALLSDHLYQEAEQRLRTLNFDDAAREAEAALTAVMGSTVLASAAMATLGAAPFDALREQYNALRAAGVVGVAIERAVQRYAAPHLRPSSILERVQSGQGSAGCWSLRALLRYAHEELGTSLCGGDAVEEDATGGAGQQYMVKETAHAGRAVFAARRLAAGSVLIHETPLRAAGVRELERIASECGALDNLCGEGPTSRVAQNYFADEQNDECLLFRRISMLNHSCRPSASIRLEEEQGALGSEAPRGRSASVVLARDVEAGEEVTLCYSGAVLFAPRSQRQAALHARWGFACHCERCHEGALTEAEARMWAQLEAAAAAADDAKPRGPEGDAHLAALQREALALLEAQLPCLVERERFRYDVSYFE